MPTDLPTTVAASPAASTSSADAVVPEFLGWLQRVTDFELARLERETLALFVEFRDRRRLFRRRMQRAEETLRPEAILAAQLAHEDAQRIEDAALEARRNLLAAREAARAVLRRIERASQGTSR